MQCSYLKNFNIVFKNICINNIYFNVYIKIDGQDVLINNIYVIQTCHSLRKKGNITLLYFFLLLYKIFLTLSFSDYLHAFTLFFPAPYAQILYLGNYSILYRFYGYI